jgi:hypothetical protein
MSISQKDGHADVAGGSTQVDARSVDQLGREPEPRR